MNTNAVLYIGSFNFNKGNASSIRVIENALFIKQFQLDVHVLGVIDNNSEIETIPINNIREQKGKPFDTNIESVIKTHNELKLIYSKVFIIAYNYPPVAFYKLIQFSKKNKIQLVADITEWYAFQGDKNIYSVIRWALNEWKMRFLLKKCYHFIFATSYLEYLFKSKNIVIMPFVTSKASERTSLIKHNNNVVYTYAGSPGHNFAKDRLDIIIMAFLELKKKSNTFIFNVIGIHNDFSEDKKINKLIKALGNNIKFYGRLTHEKTVQIIKQSDYLVFARDISRVTKVGFPTKVFEAFKYNIPVITNDSSNLSNYISSENGILLKENSVKAFFNAFIKIDSDKSIKILHKKNISKSNPFRSENFEREFSVFLEKIYKSESNISRFD